MPAVLRESKSQSRPSQGQTSPNIRSESRSTSLAGRPTDPPAHAVARKHPGGGVRSRVEVGGPLVWLDLPTSSPALKPKLKNNVTGDATAPITACMTYAGCDHTGANQHRSPTQYRVRAKHLAPKRTRSTPNPHAYEDRNIPRQAAEARQRVFCADGTRPPASARRDGGYSSDEATTIALPWRFTPERAARANRNPVSLSPS